VLGGALAGQSDLLGVDGWRWIFYVNVPIGGAALLVVSRNLALPRHRSEHRIDYVGASLLTGAVVPLLLVAEKGRDWGWGSPLTLALVAASAASLTAFVPWESRMGDEAILPMRMFRSSVFSVTNVVSLLVGAGMFGGLVVVPLYLQIVKGSSPTEAGLQLIPLMVGIIITSGISGQVMSRTGRYKRLPIVGTALMVLSMLLFSTLDAGSPIWRAMLFMVIMGAGLGLSMQTLVLSVQNAMPARDMGVATSSVTFFRSMGGTFGAAVALAILFGSVRDSIADRAREASLTPESFVGFDLDDTSTLSAIPRAAQQAVLGGFADSMSAVFLVMAGLLVPAFVLTLLIREVPLRASGGIAAAHEAAGDEAALQTARNDSAAL
jgi:MFS family permease